MTDGRRKVDFSGRLVVQRLVWTTVIIELKIACDAASGLAGPAIIVQVGE